MEGERIILLPIEPKDTELIVRWRNSPQVRRNFIQQEPLTGQIHARWLSEMVAAGKVHQFVIYEKQGCKPIGSTYLKGVDPVNHKAEFGIFIGEDRARGRGFGTEAARLTVRYGFEEVKLHKIYLRLLAENEAAYNTYLKAGFRREAYLNDEVCINGVYRDIIMMAVVDGRQMKES